MAKQALIQRELKREKLVAKFAKKYAELHDIAVTTVQNHRDRALAKLRRHLEVHLDG